MIRAHIAEHHAGLSVGISIVLTEGDGHRASMIMRLERASETLTGSWEAIPDATVAVEPTLALDHEAARALLDALLRHYEGASDMHTARQDLLHERARVDNLTGALIGLAQVGLLQAPAPSPVEQVRTAMRG